MIDALTEDVATAGSSTVIKTAQVLQQSIVTETTEDITQSSVSQPEYNPAFDLEKLQKEKEEQIQGYVELLKTSKQ